jgi:DNA-binding XRE family transcriptional regulator
MTEDMQDHRDSGGKAMMQAETPPEFLAKKRYSGYFPLPALRYWREERGYSIRELSRKADVTHDSIWRLEKQKRRAEPKTRRKLAKALRVRPKDLTNDPPAEEVDE